MKEELKDIALAYEIFHNHYNQYEKDLDIFSASSLAKRNSILYVCAILEKPINEKFTTKDYLFFVEVKKHIEMI